MKTNENSSQSSMNTHLTMVPESKELDLPKGQSGKWVSDTEVEKSSLPSHLSLPKMSNYKYICCKCMYLVWV